jgi:putative peptide zinc metalloprotease protein
MAWPRLREELDVFEGAVLADGQSSWVLHDPVRNQFFRIDWLSFEILSRWSMGNAQAILHAIARDTTLHPDSDDLERMVKFLNEQQLLASDDPKTARDMADRVAKGRSSTFNWLVHHYLFFRMPLVKPDKWLERWMPVASLFYTKGFVALTLTALGIGLYQVLQQWGTFSAALIDTFSLQGLLSYGVALAVVKVVHELGHAFTAKRHGCRIPRMGVAFLVMWPMAYTDTNDAWRLHSRRERLEVAGAGIITELVIAAWATLAWALLPDGPARSAALFLATVSWVATVAINASPFMRFDGYFITMDWFNLPNLHQRSFALARWQLREWLFQLKEQPPEIFPPLQHRTLVLFAFGTWLYRLVLFLGIAVMVYHLFTKLLGVVLFAIEIFWFILNPIKSELLEWHKRSGRIMQSGRTRLTTMVLLAFIAIMLVPLPAPIAVTGVLKPGESWSVYAPGQAQLVQLPLQEGQRVPQGNTLLQLTAPEIEAQQHAAAARQQKLQWIAASAAVPGAQSQGLQLTQARLDTANADVERYVENLALYAPKAPFDGDFHYAQQELQSGQWMREKELIGTLVSDRPWIVETWLEANQIQRIARSYQGKLWLPGRSEPIPLIIEHIDIDASRELSDPLLAAPHGGHVLVRQQNERWVPERAIYKVVLTTLAPHSPDDGPPLVMRGTVSIDANPTSLAGEWLLNALAVLLRELQP